MSRLLLRSPLIVVLLLPPLLAIGPIVRAGPPGDKPAAPSSGEFDEKVSRRSSFRPIDVTDRNTRIAQRVFKRARQIVELEFRVEAVHKLIVDLEDLVRNSDFDNCDRIVDFCNAARRLNTSRSKTNIVEKVAKAGESARDMIGGRAGVTAAPKPQGNVSVNYERQVEVWREGKTTVLIKSENPGEVLAYLRQTLATAYDRLADFLADQGFHPDIPDRQLLGKWTYRSDCAGTDYIFTLRPKGRFKAKQKPDSPEGVPGGGWVDTATGRWVLTNGRLTLTTEYVWLGPAWKAYKAVLLNERIVYIDDEVIILGCQSNNKLVRAD